MESALGAPDNAAMEDTLPGQLVPADKQPGVQHADDEPSCEATKALQDLCRQRSSPQQELTASPKTSPSSAVSNCGATKAHLHNKKSPLQQEHAPNDAATTSSKRSPNSAGSSFVRVGRTTHAARRTRRHIRMLAIGTSCSAISRLPLRPVARLGLLCRRTKAMALR